MDELSEERVVLRFRRAEALMLLSWWNNQLDPDQVGVLSDDCHRADPHAGRRAGGLTPAPLVKHLVKRITTDRHV